MTISLEIKVLAGSDIPGDVIPEMIRLADKLNINVEARLNGVLVVAYPNDDPLHLAIAWRRAKGPHPMAFAREGRELMMRP